MSVLAILENSRRMKRNSDASGQELGCMLTQSGRVLEVDSSQLRSHERNYSLKLVVVINTLKIWIHYFLRQRVEIYIDDKNLKYIFTLKELNMQQR